MDNHKILITGDYWHEDFRDVLSQIKVPTTLMSLESLKLKNIDSDSYQAVLLAQARPDQYTHEDIEILQEKFPTIPVVALVGSWCEGELRSGNPAPGSLRIYWHQWQGRYDTFAHEFNQSHISNWHMPRTAIEEDRIQAVTSNFGYDSSNRKYDVGISAHTRDGYEMVAETLCEFGFSVCWLEGPHQTPEKVDAVCINSNSLTGNLKTTILQTRRKLNDTPIVVLMNFPRKAEVDAARELGVDEIVSKPYQLADLKFAIERALNKSGQNDSHQAAG